MYPLERGMGVIKDSPQINLEQQQNTIKPNHSHTSAFIQDVNYYCQ